MNEHDMREESKTERYWLEGNTQREDRIKVRGQNMDTRLEIE